MAQQIRLSYDEISNAATNAAKKGPLGSTCRPSEILRGLEQVTGLVRDNGDEEIVAGIYDEIMRGRELKEGYVDEEGEGAPK